MNKQIALSAITDELAQARTRKKEFLEQMERIIPWGEWMGIIQPYYYKAERGNKPFELETMLRIHLLQELYDLADMAAKYEVIDSRAFSEFCGVDSSNQVPDGDTIGRFRALLVKHGLQKKLFAQVVALLEAKGFILKKGSIVDSTIIAAPSSTKNLEKKRDPDAHQTRKGNTWHFGYKAHIGVDKSSGLVHHMEVTAANVHDVTVVPKLLYGEEESVHGDSGYIGVEKREDAITHNKRGNKIHYKINRRPSQSKNNTARSRAQIKRREREKSSVRAKVEHVFWVVKGRFGYRKTRYKGRRKQEAKLHMIFALANLVLADRHCLAV
jgi:IS5 family transposase